MSAPKRGRDGTDASPANRTWAFPEDEIERLAWHILADHLLADQLELSSRLLSKRLMLAVGLMLLFADDFCFASSIAKKINRPHLSDDLLGCL